MSRIFALFLLTCCCTGCLYRMPTEDDAAVIPTTNNPNIVNQRDAGWMPGLSY